MTGSCPLRLPLSALLSELSEPLYHRGLAGLGVSVSRTESESGQVDSGAWAPNRVCVCVVERGWTRVDLRQRSRMGEVAPAGLLPLLGDCLQEL